jgi:hypothetical protein
MRSQLVASTSPFKPLDSGHPAVTPTPTPNPTQLDDPGIITGMWSVTGQTGERMKSSWVSGLKKRIRELEKEVESLKVDNEKQVSQALTLGGQWGATAHCDDSGRMCRSIAIE